MDDRQLLALLGLHARATKGVMQSDVRSGVVAVYPGELRNCLEDGAREVHRVMGTHRDGYGWEMDAQAILDANYIAAAWNAVPELVVEILRLREILDELKAVA